MNSRKDDVFIVFFFKDGLTFVLLCLFDRVSPASQVVFRCTHLSPPVSAFQVRGGGGVEMGLQM